MTAEQPYFPPPEPSDGAGPYLFSGTDEIRAALANPRQSVPYMRQNNENAVAEAGLAWGERLTAAGTGLMHGVTTYAPERLYRTLRTIGKMSGSTDLMDWASEGIERELRARELDPFYQVPESWMNDGWGKALYDGTSSAAASFLSMLPGLAASAAFVPFTGGASLTWPMLISAVSGGGMAGLAEYDQFMDEAYAQFSALDPDLTREDMEDEKFWQAVLSGVSEGGAEVVGDVMFGKIARMFGKAGVQPVRNLATKMFQNMTKGAITEMGTEAATAFAQDAIREWAQMDHAGRLTAMKNALGPSAVAGALFGGAGTVTNAALGRETTAPVSQAQMKSRIDLHFQQIAVAQMAQGGSPQAASLLNDLFAEGMSLQDARPLVNALDAAGKRLADAAQLSPEAFWNDQATWRESAQRLVDALRAEGATLETVLNDGGGFLFQLLPADTQRALSETYQAVAEDGTPFTDSASLWKDFEGWLRGENELNPANPMTAAFETMRTTLADTFGGVDPRDLSAMDAVSRVTLESVHKAQQPATDHVYTPPNPVTVNEAQVRELSGIVANVVEASGSHPLAARALDQHMGKIASAFNLDLSGWGLEGAHKALILSIEQAFGPDIAKRTQYGRHSNDATQKRAEAVIRERGYSAEAVGQYFTDTQDLPTKVFYAMMAEKVLIHKAAQQAQLFATEQSNDAFIAAHAAIALARQVHADFRGIRSNVGRALQILSRMNRDPLIRHQGMDLLSDQFGDREVMLKLTTVLANANTLADQETILQNTAGALTVKMVTEGVILSLLSNPTTHIVNIMGNAIHLVGETLTRSLASFSGNGTGVARGEATQFILGMWDGLKKAKTLFTDLRTRHGGTVGALANLTQADWDSGVGTSSASDAGVLTRKLNKENAQQVIGGAKRWVGLSGEHGAVSNGLSTAVEYLGRLLGLNSTALLAADQLFKQVSYSAEIRAQAHREAVQTSGGDAQQRQRTFATLMKTPTLPMKDAALATSKYMVFQQDLGSFTKKLNQIRAAHPWTRLVVPFLKTPVNLLKVGMAHTPVLNQALGEVRAQLKSSDPAVRQIAEARVMLGTMMWGTALAAAAAGYLTGQGPSDPEERRKLLATGWQPNSLRLPNGTYIGLNRLDPAAFVLNTAASLTEIVDSADDADWEKAAHAMIGQSIRLVTDRTYLQSLSDFMDMLSDWEGNVDRTARRVGSMLLPGSAALRATARSLDPVQREIEGVVGAVVSNVPGVSLALPAKRNFLGEVETMNGQWGPDWLSPFKLGRNKGDPVYDEFARLSHLGLNAASTPQRVIRRGERSVKLDGEQYNRYLALAGTELRIGGQTMKQRLSRLVASEGYQRLDDEDRQTRLTAVVNTYRRAARTRLMQTDPGVRYLLGLDRD